MQRRVVFGWLACAVLIGTATTELAADDSFPYTAYITSDDVYVRSGPGRNYYPTTKLARGATVEVYRHDPGGWYAIRPPQPSFSWISGRYVQAEQDGIGVITGDRVVARVGSEFSDIRDVIQVRLYEGEEVELLGTKQFGSGPGAQTWYQVAPPAGEFRWIYGKFVDQEPPAYAHSRPEDRQNLIIRDIEREEAASETAEPAETAVAENEITPDDESRAVRRASASVPREERETRRSSSDQARDTKTNQRTTGQGGPRSTQDDAQLSASTVTSDDSPAVASDFRDQLDALNLELSMMVAEEPTVWSFTALRARAEKLVHEAQTAVERGKVRLLVGRIDRFEDVARRYQAVAELGADTDALDQQLAGINRLQRASVRRIEPRVRYDGSGRLARVNSSEFGAPPYALIDGDGQVRHYLTPAPGVNLQHYLGREIGVVGYRSNRPELPAGHLTAKRITLLDPPTRH